jgi:predicted nucleotidyltransferase component of viral defense system
VKQPPRKVAASVRQRLLNIARESGEDFNLILSRYASERLLYRLSISAWRERFLLKGALLFHLWDPAPHRPTRDIDLLASGSSDIEAMAEIFREICGLDVDDDGIQFHATTVRAIAIREDAVYDGICIQFQASLDSACISMQVDVGFGDAVTPAPQLITLPTLLDYPAPRLSAYPVYTVIAEKYHAMVLLGMANSRMKDYFDLVAIARNQALDGAIFHEAIVATFERRRTPLPGSIPHGLSEEFARDAMKQTQWNAFLRRNGLPPLPLESVIEMLVTLFALIHDSGKLDYTTLHWQPGGPWQS